MPSLQVENLSVFVQDMRLVGPVSFRIEAGEALVIMGETGAGKSLLAQAILGTLPHGLNAEGKIWLDGNPIDGWSSRQRRTLWGHRVAMLPQEPWRALDPLMKSVSQIAETYRFVAGRNREAAHSEAVRDFELLGLKGAENRLPRALSGGMAQRVAFAATRAGGAPILIADEPTKGLDFERRDQVADLLAQVTENAGVLLAITHDVALARRLGGQMMVLKSGELMEEGVTDAVLASPQSAYTRSIIEAEPACWPTHQDQGGRGDVVLSARQLRIDRGDRTLIEGFDFDLKIGERVAITGPSGIGKSSLLDCFAGLRAPTSGRVLRGDLVGQMGVQKLYQDPPAAFPAKRSLEKILKDVVQRHHLDWDHVMRLLERLGVSEDLLSRRADQVSGGELQRISLVRVLSLSPKVLLADEPTSRLDPITQRETMEVIADVAAERGIAVVLVTHDPDIASRWAHRHVSLSEYQAAGMAFKKAAE